MEETPKPKKRKLTKAAEAKLKAKAKAKKAKDEDDDDFEDAYTALVKDSYKSTRPPIGSFENCARCNQQFTVVRHTRDTLQCCIDPVLRRNIQLLPCLLRGSCATSAQNRQEPTLSRSLLLRGSVKHPRINARSFTSRNSEFPVSPPFASMQAFRAFLGSVILIFK